MIFGKWKRTRTTGTACCVASRSTSSSEPFTTVCNRLQPLRRTDTMASRIMWHRSIENEC